MYIKNLCLKYKNYFFILFLFAIIAATFSVSIEYGIKQIIDRINSKDFDGIYLLLSWFVLLKFSWHGIHWIWRIVELHYKPLIINDIMQNSYSIISKHSLHWFEDNFSGSIVNKISDIQSNFATLITASFRSLRDLLKLLFSLFLLFIVNQKIFFCALFIATIFGTIMFFTMKKQLSLQKLYDKTRQKTIGILNDIISNIFIVKIISSAEKEKIFKLEPELKNWIKSENEVRKFNLFFVDSTSTIFLTLFLIQIFLAVNLYSHNQITLGSLILSIKLSFNIGDLTNDVISNFVDEINPKIGTIKSSSEILDKKFNFNDSENAIKITNVIGKIEFKNVSFAYPNNKQILHNLNIDIKAGEKIGIVGKSGAGKTTFVKCLLRYFDVKNGEVYIDNLNIKDITQESLYENISIIQQDSAVFHRTILENLQVANYNATFEEIVEICKKAQIHNDIIAMRDGYQTIVGERGVKLSGGQKQRIAIARAMLKNSKIIIMDEATSALDSPTEKLIQNAIDETLLNSDKTIIVIAHRLSTIKNMDRILVFENGQILESGTHEKLLSLNGNYKKLFDAQNYFY